MGSEDVYKRQILDDPGPFKLPLFPARYTISAGAVRGSWCLQVHVASAFSRAVQRNVDDSIGAAVISSLSRRRRARHFSGFWFLPLGLLLVASAYWDLSLLLGLLPTFSASWDLRFLFGWFLGAFCVLRSSSFSLGSLRYFGVLMSGFGASLA